MKKTKREMMAKMGWVQVPDQKPGIYRREHYVDNRYPSDWMHVPVEVQQEFEAYKSARNHDE